MFGYILFFFILFFLSMQKYSKRTFVLMSVTLFVFSAIRYQIGFDYRLYENLMLGTGDSSLSYYEERLAQIEPLSQILLIIAQKTDTFVFFFLSSLIIVGIYCKCIAKSSPNPVMSLWIYIAMPFFMLDQFSIVRNAMAYAMVFLCMTYHFDKSRAFFKQLLCIIVASMFHVSGMIGIITLIPLEKLGKKMLWIIFFFSFFIGSILLPKISLILYFNAYAANQLDYYINGDMNLSGGALMKFFCLGLCATILLYYDRVARLGLAYKYYLSLICLGGSFYAIFLPFPHVAQRLFTFFFSPILIVLPALFSSLKVRKQIIIMVSLTLFTVYVANMHRGTADKKGISAVYPYKTIFERKY